MAVLIDIEKNFQSFRLKVKIESQEHSMGILGASGSGKSMTLRCIAGIEKPDRGRIVIGDKVLFDSEKKINLKPQERRIGYLFQNYALFPSMTVEENIACGLRRKDSRWKEQIGDFLRRYHLEGLEKHYPCQLSGGQQQRVALARMMIGKPDMILLDEPFSALDGYLKDVLQRDMLDFLQEYTGDMIMVTHSRDEAFKFCGQLTLLKEGKTLLTGQTCQVFRQPRLLEAARLTGCKNFSSIERLDEFHLFAADWGISLATEERIGSQVTHVGIRGHWLRPVQEPGENCLPVQVSEYIETTFEHQYMICNRDMENASAIWWMRPKNSFTEDETSGIPPYLYLPPEHLMLLE